MEKMNSRLEDFLRDITPYAGKAHPFVSVLTGQSFKDLTKKSAYVDELKALGMIKPTDSQDVVPSCHTPEAKVYFPDFFALTSKGESYFEDMKKQEDTAIAKEKRDRRWQIATIVLSAAGSLIVTLIANIILLNISPAT